MWMAHRYCKLHLSPFGRAISGMNNPDSSNIPRLRDELFGPNDVDHIPPIKWDVDQKSLAIEGEDQAK